MRLTCDDCKRDVPEACLVVRRAADGPTYHEVCEACYTRTEAAFAREYALEPRPFRAMVCTRGSRHWPAEEPT